MPKSRYFDEFRERLQELASEKDRKFWVVMQETFPPMDLALNVAEAEKQGYPAEVCAEAMFKLIQDKVKELP